MSVFGESLGRYLVSLSFCRVEPRPSLMAKAIESVGIISVLLIAVCLLVSFAYSFRPIQPARWECSWK